MPVSKSEIENVFSVGSVIASGGGRRYFRITEILEDRVRIQPTESPTASRLRYDKLSVVIDNFSAIDSSRIEATVGEVLSAHGLQDTQNESYLYGLARAYLGVRETFPNEYIQVELERGVESSRNYSPSERRARLNRASKVPKKILVTTTAYQRNPDVIVEVLERADGICENCGNPAPFTRQRDGTPYLEVHHKLQLSLGGEDTVENAIALCPNCHRKSHYG